MIHPSSLPRVFACPASLLPCTAPVNTSTPESELGTAVHSFLREHVRRNDPAMDRWPLPTAVDREQFTILARAGMTLWRESLSGYMQLVQCEVPMQAGILEGTADLLDVSTWLDRVCIADWKTSWRSEADYAHQLRAYAWLAMAHHPSIQHAVVSTVWLRELSVETAHYTRQDLEDWYLQLEQLVQDPEKPHAPGRACAFCPRQHECAARTSMLQQSVGWLEGTHQDWLRDMQITPAILGLLHERRKQVEAACAALAKVEKAALEAIGGALELDDERTLVLVREEQRKIKYQAGREILRRVLGEQLEGVLRIGKGDLEKAIAAGAPRGQKGARIAAVMEELTAAGAVESTFIEKLEIKREPKPARLIDSGVPT